MDPYRVIKMNPDPGTPRHWEEFISYAQTATEQSLVAGLWIRIRIRIRIGSGFNRVSGSGFRRAKMTHKSRLKF
jgi:hypothetical protein